MSGDVIWELRNIKLVVDRLEYPIEDVVNLRFDQFISELTRYVGHIIRLREFRSLRVSHTGRANCKIVIHSDLSDPFSVYRELVGFSPINNNHVFSSADFKRITTSDYDKNLSGFVQE